MMGTAFLGYSIAQNEFKIKDINNDINKKCVTNKNQESLKNSFNNFITQKNLKFKKKYINLHLLDVQQEIRNDNKQKSGIYLICNLINHKSYIGSAVSNRINTRFRNHCIHYTGNKILRQAIIKYGLENFAFIIIEYYPGFVKKENLGQNHLNLINLEQS